MKSITSYKNIVILFIASFIILLILPLDVYARTGSSDSAKSYFPMQVGNIWQFKYTWNDSIFAAPEQIFGTTIIDDTLYYQFGEREEYPILIRPDSLGRILRRYNDKEIIWFDFTLVDSAEYEYPPNSDDPYIVTVRRDVSIQTYAGYFENCIEFFFDIPLTYDEELWFIFAPGVGMVSKQYGAEYMLLASANVNGNIIVTVDENSKQPTDYILDQNYPNPFQSKTNISYFIPNPGFVTLKIYNLRGKEIATLVNKKHPQGRHELQIDGTKYSSGLYFYRIFSEGFTQTKKLILKK